MVVCIEGSRRYSKPSTREHLHTRRRASRNCDRSCHIQAKSLTKDWRLERQPICRWSSHVRPAGTSVCVSDLIRTTDCELTLRGLLGRW